MRRTLALAGIAVLGVTGLAGPASADPGAGVTDHGGIFINEFSVDLVDAGTSNDIDGTFLELINHNPTATSIADFEVSGCDATNAREVIAQVPAGVMLDPNETYLIADDTYASGGGDAPNLGFDNDAPDLVQADGGLLLTNSPSGTPQDDVKWGDPQDLDCASFVDANVLPTDDESVNRSFVNDTWFLDNEPTPTRAVL